MPRLHLLCLLLLGGLVLPACGPTQSNAGEDRRIVCLIPAVTRMLVDLGLEDQIVGVAEHDTLAKKGRPIVGNFASVDIEKLLALEPDLVITLRSKDSPSRRLVDLAKRGSFELYTERYPRSFADVSDTLHRRGDDNDLGDQLGMPEQATALRQRLLNRLRHVRRATEELEPVTVLMCIGLDPVMASGQGTVHDQLLATINATNAVDKTLGTAPQFDREMLLAMQPQVILLLRPNDPPLQGEDDPRLDAFRGLAIPAVQNQRIYLINDPHAMLPSTNLPDLAATFAERVHGITLPPTEAGDG